MARAWFRKVFNGLFFLLLGSLPILVLLGGWRFTAERQEFFDNLDQERTAAEIHDALALGWEPREQLKLRGGAFLRSALKPGSPEVSPQLITCSGKENFGVFPGKLVFLFRFPGIGFPANFELVSAPDILPEGRKGFGIIFSFLVRRNAGEPQSDAEVKLAGKVIRKSFGESVLPDLMGDFLKGSPARVVFRGRFHWLAWDYRFLPNRKTGFGYLILVPDNPQMRETAFRLAISNAISGRKALAGFVGFFPTGVSDVFSPALARSDSFRKWLDRFHGLPRHLELERANLDRPPWKTRLGRWDLFTSIVPSSTHLSVVLLPARNSSAGSVLFDSGLAMAGFLLVTLLIHSVFREGKVEITFRSRFAIIFSLAFALPLSLAISAGSAYFAERKRTLSEDLKKRLETELERFEKRQDMFRSLYQAAFSRISGNDRIRELLSQRGLIGIGNRAGTAITPQGKEILEISMRCFEESGTRLPVSFLEFLDAEGNSISTGTNRKISRVEGVEVGFLRASLITTLRDRFRAMRRAEPPGKNPISSEDRQIVKGFARFTGMTSISVHTEERLGSIQHLTSGRNPTYQFFTFIPLPGREPVALMVLWKTGGFRKGLIESALREFRERNPDLKIFIEGFQASPAGAFKPSREEEPVLAMARSGSRLRELGNRALLLAKRSPALFDKVLGIEAPLKPIRDELGTLTSLLVSLPIIGLLTATVFGLFAWQRMGSPLIGLKDALAAVSEGDFSRRIGVSRADEIGLLTRSFDHMIEGLSLRARFAPLVSGKALDALSRHDSPAAAVSGRSAWVVALVSDIRNFTTLCESQPLDRITDLLNRHFEEMSVIIARHGGQVDRFIGDAILAIFEEPLQDSGEAPMRAGIAMLGRLAELTREREAAGLFPYRIGIGLAAGEVVIGGVGDPSIRFDFAILGNPMKDAATLEGLSKEVPHFPLVADGRTREISGGLALAMAPHPADPSVFAFPSGSLPLDFGKDPRARDITPVRNQE